MQSYATVAILVLLFSALLLALYAKADEWEEYEEEHAAPRGEEVEHEEHGYEEYEDYAEVLGEVAFYGGLALNIFFIAVRWARLVASIPPGLTRLALELHMSGNPVLAALGLIHGYMMSGAATILEYIIAVLIVVLVATGLVLRYARHRGLKAAARLLHTQRALTILLLALLIVHVTARG